MHFKTKAVRVKTKREIDLIRESCQLAVATLAAVAERLKPGMTTNEIDAYVHESTLRQGAVPAPLNYRGFPKSVCTSINDVVCHGIPDETRLRSGDIVNIDVTHLHKGYHGDTSATFYIGDVSDEARHVTEVARKCLELGIAEVRPGARLGDLGAAIQTFAESHGCSVVRDFVGHGIGRDFHEEPQVKHYGTRGRGIRLKPGMVFTIEPMINLGDFRVRTLEDGWTAVTTDGSLSAQFEHTLVVTESGHEVLTRRSKPLANSEILEDYWVASKAAKI